MLGIVAPSSDIGVRDAAVLSASFHEASAIMNSLSEMHEAMVALSDADISEKRQHVDRLLVRYERLRLAKSPNCTRYTACTLARPSLAMGCRSLLAATCSPSCPNAH